MRLSAAKVLPMAAFVFLAACSNNNEPAPMPEIPEMQSVSGTVSYRERILLTTNATVNVRLLDVSKADVSAILIAEQTIETPGQMPVSFELLYNPEVIDERMSYAVHARIFEGSELRFTTDTNYPVLTRGNGNSVDLILVAVGDAPVSAGIPPVTWQLLELRGEAVSFEEGRYPNIRISEADNTVSGFSGCNQFSGSFMNEAGELATNALAMTMMACPDSVVTEQAFMRALGEADSFKVVGESLLAIVTDESGGETVIMSFKPAQQ